MLGKDKDVFKLLEDGVLKKGCKVKLALKQFEGFVKIEDAFIHKARPFELEDDWVVVVIDGQIIDSAWIEEIEGIS